MNVKADASTHGIGFIGLLTIVLIVLKATGFLNIPWWMVFLPILVSVIFGLIMIIAFIIFLKKL